MSAASGVLSFMLRLLSITPGKLTELKEVKFRVENVYIGECFWLV